MAGVLQGKDRSIRWSDYDPFRLSWRLLTSVRFALGLIGFLALIALLGVIIPQVPNEMRGNVAAETAWYGLQNDELGILYGPIRTAGRLRDLPHALLHRRAGDAGDERLRLHGEPSAADLAQRVRASDARAGGVPPARRRRHRHLRRARHDIDAGGGAAQAALSRDYDQRGRRDVLLRRPLPVGPVRDLRQPPGADPVPGGRLRDRDYVSGTAGADR